MTTTKTNLVINNNNNDSTISATTLIPTKTIVKKQTIEDVEQGLLSNILWPFMNRYAFLRSKYPAYEWQDFILNSYDECFVPLHSDPLSRHTVCQRLARLFWSDGTKPYTKEHYSWMQLYSPYLALVPLKLHRHKSYSAQERSIITIKPSFPPQHPYAQILVDAPLSRLPPMPSLEKEEEEVTIIKTKEIPSLKRKREIERREGEEDDPTELGRRLAVADAHVVRAIRIYEMAISYHNELARKCEQHRLVTVPQKLKQIEMYKKQRSELVAKINNINKR